MNTATQPSNSALLGIIVAVLALIAVVAIGFFIFALLARRSSTHTESSSKVDKELENDEDPTS
jgi:flagellar basal body-associated protein FliL